jgi:glycosyltransferase involved in cell wall biosynthesis
MQVNSEKLTYVFVQSQPSQLDATFYGELAKLMPGKSLVVLFNKTANQRQDIDPELGLTPVFPDLDEGYKSEWIAYGKSGLFKLMKRIANSNPACVVLQDQKWQEKIILALFCKLLKIRVAMRSDKNHLSIGARKGISLYAERFLVKRLFNILCPISELTVSYYDWPKNREYWLFPYCTNESKFAPPDDPIPMRRLIRSRFGIPGDAFVFLSVVKFIDRENPKGVIHAFSEVVKSHQNAWLLMVGSGPQFNEISDQVSQDGIRNIVFAGYIPYTTLEECFFAADIFLHLAKNEPWGISPQDALVAGLGLITSDKVGSGIHHLRDELRRFVLPIDNLSKTVERMIELAEHGQPKELFQSARMSAMNGFTADSLADEWAQRVPN